MKRTTRPSSHIRQRGAHGGGAGGFTLLELLIVMLLASGLALVCFNALLADGQVVGRMAEGWRQRQERERTLDLIRHDLVQGDDLLLDPGLAEHRCSMKGRKPVLVIVTEMGMITYAIGPAPSSIWTTPVLLRCGPAFTKAGVWSQKAFLSRVLIDRLQPPDTPWQQCPTARGVEMGNSFALPLAVCMELDTGLVTVRLSQGQGDSTTSAALGLDHFTAAGFLEGEAGN